MMKLIRTNGLLRGMRLRPAPYQRDSLRIPEELIPYARKVARADGASALRITRVERAVQPVSRAGQAAQQQRRAQKARIRRRKKATYIAVQAVLIAIMLFAVGKLGEHLQSNVEGSEHRHMMEEFVFDSPSTPVATPNRPVPTYPLATPERVVYPTQDTPTLEKLQALKDINSDFRFWLYIPDTEINYYIMQGPDNDKYLHTTIYGYELDSGSCFLDYRNNAQTMEGHTIIYGHTMNDLSVFGGLRKYMKEDYFMDHRNMYTFSLDGVTQWRIFSVYNTTIDVYYIKTSFTNDEEYLEFIQGLNNKSFFDTGIQLTAQDDVLTLSTCYRPVGGANGRLTVHAVKVGTMPIM